MKNNNRFLVSLVLVLGLISVNAITAQAASVSGQGTWETTLQGRDLDGNAATFEAYYDTVLNITWLADGNYAKTTSDSTDVPTMTLGAAMNWVTSLNINGYKTGWRLPKLSPIDGTTADDATISYDGSEDLGYNISAPGTLYAGSTVNEMAHLYYTTLGNKSPCAPTSVYPDCIEQSIGNLLNAGPFSNYNPGLTYWTSTEYAPDTRDAWCFGMGGGLDCAPEVGDRPS